MFIHIASRHLTTILVFEAWEKHLRTLAASVNDNGNVTAQKSSSMQWNFRSQACTFLLQYIYTYICKRRVRARVVLEGRYDAIIYHFPALNIIIRREKPYKSLLMYRCVSM
ncbi:uncharacterized protein LOC110118144 isoform X2 [Ceratitis capitata]|uniref:uncharacterized protein LOC110118144 isoform X2 n=1 Tax=Ceratitis capitata TaxID=7213 RepID=UPI000A109A9F|nr:uncharacterized protein LOC110118144 isoform X2 [Ceratitis capitata]